MKKIITAFLAALLAIFGAVSAFGAIPSPTGEFYVNDFAGVLTDETKRHIVDKGNDLYGYNGAQIVIVTVSDTGKTDIADYCLKMFNNWKIGDAARNNGVLVLLSIDEDDYYTTTGKGVDEKLGSGYIVELVDKNLEDDFAAKDYDSGVKAAYDALYKDMRKAWPQFTNGAAPSSSGGEVSESAEGGFFGSILRLISDIFIFILIAVVVIIVFAIAFAAPRRRYYDYGTPPVYVPWYRRWWGYGGYHHHHHHHTPPPPRYHGGGGWGAPPSGGGRSNGGSRPSGGGISFGGGGTSRGGGGGRSSGGFGGGFGGGRSSGGGGMSRGGGGGRRK